MEKILKSTLLFVAGLVIILLTFWIASKAIGRSEEVECWKWKQQAIDYKNVGFYLTKWQKAQCDHYRIDIDAPVQ